MMCYHWKTSSSLLSYRVIGLKQIKRDQLIIRTFPRPPISSEERCARFGDIKLRFTRTQTGRQRKDVR